MNFDSTKSTIW